MTTQGCVVVSYERFEERRERRRSIAAELARLERESTIDGRLVDERPAPGAAADAVIRRRFHQRTEGDPC